MKYLSLSTLLIAVLFAFSACGGEQPAQQAQQEDVTVDDGVRTIDIIGTDNMRFVVREAADGLVTGGAAGRYILLEAIEAAPGEEIRIRLTTESNMPPTAMSHNLAVVDLGTDLDRFTREALQAADNAYIPPAMEDRVIATTAMLGAGQTDTITFTVPETEGEYDYICSFPGHFQGGMVGKLIVSE
ncbi:MAG: plastocyanin/azurin family copper-binding protein [Balneolaceae bacterium]